VGAYSAAMFHLFNHAFFKCLLFLGAGSANHASGTFDMRYMGGLRKHQPWTYATFLVAALSLAGIFPLAGFWSKDEVLAAALVKGTPVGLLVFILALSAVFMTAFYIFRVLFLTWHGEFRGGAEAEARDAAEAHPAAPASHASPPSQRGVPGHGGHGAVRLAESPAVMVIPMVVLGLLAVASGALANPPTALASIPAHWFGSFVVPPEAAEEGPRFTLWLAVLSTLIALAGIGLAYLVYAARRVRPEAVTVRPLYQMISRKYFMDDLYEGMLTGRLFYGAACGVLDWFDRSVVDGVADTVGWFGQNVGRGLARLQTGQLQAYGAAITIGVAAIVIAYLLWG
ncbi:MAG: hypothetical protein HY686_08195, partial [Chloroflexi bacterium]|nr:hypothetical protein [Chloroflexota bacterium]